MPIEHQVTLQLFRSQPAGMAYIGPCIRRAQTSNLQSPVGGIVERSSKGKRGTWRYTASE